MDQETIRLIVVASGAILAGTSGALIAGGFNRGSTLRTLASARRADAQQALRDKRIEHMRWHRDQKLIAYQAFLSEAEKAAANWDSEDSLPSPAALRSARAHVKVLGSVRVRKAAAEITYDYLHLRHLVEIEAVKGNTSEVDLRVNELGKSIDTYVEAVRSDLGTWTEEDAAFRTSRAERRASLRLPRSRSLDRFGGGEEEEEE